VTTDSDLLPLEAVLARSELLIVATPHAEYRNLKVSVPVIDVFNLRGDGVRI
jgi:UDP-N-acetyl-D-mannosaminuronic acid dehydrogenase